MPQLNLQSVVHSVQMSLVFVTTFFSNVVDDVTTWPDRLGSENFPIPVGQSSRKRRIEHIFTPKFGFVRQ